MAGQKGSLSGRCQGCNHPERVRIERFLAAGASIKGAARKFSIDYHALIPIVFPGLQAVSNTSRRCGSAKSASARPKRPGSRRSRPRPPQRQHNRFATLGRGSLNQHRSPHPDRGLGSLAAP
jgi:hypothetical protein